MKKRQQFSSPEEIGGIPNKKTAMDFMVAKNALKKKIQEAIQDATGPKSLKERLSGAVQKLSQEQLDELQKQVGPSAHDKLITNNINALKDLSTQLQGAGRTETDTIEVNITTNKEELQTISEAGEEQLEAVNYLLEQSKRHIRARLATRPTQGSCGSRYAKFVVEKEPALLADMVDFADLQSASFDTPKLWTKDGSKTKSLIDHITDYQNNSVTQISCKTNSPHREPQARQVDWCHGKVGAK